MSNFIKNLARRGAGLPVAAECRPTSAPAFEGSLEASDGFGEITSEATVGTHVDAPSMHSPQTLNTSSVPQVQPSAMEQVSAAPQQKSSPPPTTTVLQPAAAIETIVSSTEITTPQTDAPRANEIVVHPIAVMPRNSESTVRDEAARSEVDRPKTRSLPATRSALGSQQPEPALLQISVTDQHESRGELVTTDHLIRPVATEPSVSLEFPSRVSPSTTPPPAPQLPIQVRIGRVEVRGKPPAPEPTRATPMETPQLGFASYQRLRRYRN